MSIGVLLRSSFGSRVGEPLWVWLPSHLSGSNLRARFLFLWFLQSVCPLPRLSCPPSLSRGCVLEGSAGAGHPMIRYPLHSDRVRFSFCMYASVFVGVSEDTLAGVRFFLLLCRYWDQTRVTGVGSRCLCHLANLSSDLALSLNF